MTFVIEIHGAALVGSSCGRIDNHQIIVSTAGPCAAGGEIRVVAPNEDILLQVKTERTVPGAFGGIAFVVRNPFSHQSLPFGIELGFKFVGLGLNLNYDTGEKKK